MHEQEYINYLLSCYHKEVAPVSFKEWFATASLDEVMGLNEYSRPKLIVEGLTDTQIAQIKRHALMLEQSIDDWMANVISAALEAQARYVERLEQLELEIGEQHDLSVLSEDEIEEIDLNIETIIPDTYDEADTITELIASAASSSNNHDDNTGRWTVLKLYRTYSGKFLCYELTKTLWQSDLSRLKAETAKNHEQVIAFFGNGWLAKELYAEAGIDAAIESEVSNG